MHLPQISSQTINPVKPFHSLELYKVNLFKISSPDTTDLWETGKIIQVSANFVHWECLSIFKSSKNIQYFQPRSKPRKKQIHYLNEAVGMRNN